MENHKLKNRREALKIALKISGGVAAFPILASIGCRSSDNLNWQPSFLENHEAQAIAHIGDIILPKSSSPSASEVHVSEFVDLIINDCYSTEQKAAFQTSLNQMLKEYRDKNATEFNEADQGDQESFLAEMDSRISHGNTLSFFATLKELILLGYFTSEVVMKNHLNYHAIAGRYDGCIPFASGDGVYVDNNVVG